MKADISRDTFQAARDIRRVIAQQGRPWLDADWNEQVSVLLHRLETLAADMFGEYAAIGDGFKVDAVEGETNKFSVGPGRYYVHGLMCESDGAWDPPDMKFDDNKPYLVYIHAWEEYESGAEDPAMVEPALRGIDTAGRTRIRWDIGCELARGTRQPGDDEEPAWKAFKGDHEKPAARLKLQTRARAAAGEPARARGRAAYRVDNTLYRVEVHSVKTRSAGIKWARNNGSTVLAVSPEGSSLKVHNAGDLDSAFQSNRWIEITQGPGQESSSPASPLHEIQSIDREAGVIHVTPAPAPGDNLFARPWLGYQELQDVKPAWVPLDESLEFGVEVANGRELRPGQYWIIPVRTEGGGQVYWPLKVPKQGIVNRWLPLDDKLEPALPHEPDQSSHQRLSDEGPAGRAHYYGPLALITFGANGQFKSEPTDLRKPFSRKP
jgi:Family of unknown function (DUF6519)